jgi:hypothetical protein
MLLTEFATVSLSCVVVNCCCNRTDGLVDDVISEKPEAFGRTLLEVAVPFLMAGFGCVFAGILLDIVQVGIEGIVCHLLKLDGLLQLNTMKHAGLQYRLAKWFPGYVAGNCDCYDT